MQNESAASRRAALLLVGAGMLIGLAAGLVAFYGLPALPTGEALDLPLPEITQRSAPAPVVGAPGPDFGLQDLDGELIRLSDFRGQVVFLNFWATWCEPCRIEMPAIQARYEALKDSGLVVLAVNLDEPAEDVRAFAQAFGLTFPILLDPGAKINDLYRVRGYPTTFILDREGMIVQLQIGLMSERQMDNYLAAVGLGE